MDILFIHGNYPGQFRHLCSRLGASNEHRTIFLTARRDAAKDKIKGVEIKVFEQHRPVNPETHHYLHATEEAVLQGQAVLRSIEELLASGFNPKAIIYHGGMGFGMFLRDLLPDTTLVGYFEWWFTSKTTKNLVNNFDLNTQLSCGMRNLPTFRELESCDAAIVPTLWQKKQFPEFLQEKLKVVFDGIDTRFFHPATEDVKNKVLRIQNRVTKERFELSADTVVLSYATRGMEPLRGFPEFMRSLPDAFKNIRGLEVVIAGTDRCAYSYPAPSHEGSWKRKMLAEIEGQVPRDRIHFTGLLSYEDYRSLLWRSDLHCYFTRPYVTSWSLFEALSCGCSLISNYCEATKGIAIADTVNWVDLECQQEINSKVVSILSDSDRENKKKSKIIGGYELSKSLEKWQIVLNDCIRKKKI